MNAREPLVSVVIPCFNAARTITRTISSVRRQTYRRFEIIAVDDCSTDATVELLRQWAADEVRVIERKRNGGAAAARNDAIAVARGEFLAFIDADDEWHQEKLRRQLDLIAMRDDVVLVGCRADEQRLDGRRVPVNPDRALPAGPDAWRTMLHHSCFTPSVVLARTETVRRIGGFDIALRAGEDDQDFCIRMALAGEIAFVDDVLTTMHEQPGSLSARFMCREHKTTLPMILRHCRQLQHRLTRDEFRQILGARYTQVGRNVYPLHPAIGIRLIVQAIFRRVEPFGNAWYLITASPLARRVKSALRRAI